jgi:hypothetical protein
LERSEEHDNEDQIRKLEERLDALAAKMQRQEKSDRTATPIRDRPGLVSQQQPAKMEARKEITEKNGKNKKCYNCSSQLHLWAQCPERKPTDRNRPWQQARVNQLTSLGAHFYVPTLVNKGGQSFHTNFLLDTGSNAEIVPEYFSKWSTSAMKPVKTRVYSASGQEIPITGAISLDLTIGNTRMTCQFLCSPYITEAILGIQWLLANKANWQIAEGTLSIRGHTIQLLHSPESNRVRRIYAAEDVKVPPLHVCLIPIRMPRDNVSGKPACWSTEPRAIGNKLLAPRCLLNDQTSGFLEVANPVAQPAYIRKNALLGKAIYVALENANLAINDNDDRRSVNQLRQQGAAPAENDHADQASAICTAAAQQAKARDASALVSTSSENNLSEEQQKIIDQMLKTVDAEVGEEIKGRIRQILVDKIQAFSCHSMDIGTFADFQLKLQLKDPSAAPVRAPQFRMSSAQEAVIENHVQELMAAKILVPADVNCRWSSNLLAVPKPATITTNPDGSTSHVAQKFRVVCDLRGVNDAVIPFSYNIGDREATIHSLAHAKFMCKFDLKAAYHAIEIHPESRHILTVRTRKHLLSYARAPFGLAESGSVFCFLLDRLIERMQIDRLHSYMDDIVLGVNQEEQGLSDLANFLDNIIRAGLKLNHEKAALFASSIEILGFRVHRGKTYITEQRAQHIARLSFPKSRRQVRRILGIINFLAGYLPNHAALVQPFKEMLRGPPRKIIETPALSASFQRLKNALIQNAQLAIFSPDLPIHIHVDSSDRMAAAVLGNWHEDGFQPVQYTSYIFDEKTIRFCTVRKELEALLLALRRFKHLIMGRLTHVFTDSAAVAHIFKAKRLCDLFARKIDFISSFHLQFHFLQGTRNVLADAISRDLDLSQPYIEQIVCSLENPCKRCQPRGKVNYICVETDVKVSNNVETSGRMRDADKKVRDTSKQFARQTGGARALDTDLAKNNRPAQHRLATAATENETVDPNGDQAVGIEPCDHRAVKVIRANTVVDSMEIPTNAGSEAAIFNRGRSTADGADEGHAQTGRHRQAERQGDMTGWPTVDQASVHAGFDLSEIPASWDRSSQPGQSTALSSAKVPERTGSKHRPGMFFGPPSGERASSNELDGRSTPNQSCEGKDTRTPLDAVRRQPTLPAEDAQPRLHKKKYRARATWRTQS